MHISPDGADTRPAHRLGISAGHQRLQLPQRRRHASGGHQHLRHEGPVGGEGLTQIVHAADQPAGQDLLRRPTLLQRLPAQRQHLFLLSLFQRCGQAGQYVAVLDSGARRLPHGDSPHPAWHRRQIEPRHVQRPVVVRYGPVDVLVHMGIHRPRQAIGDGGNIVPTRAAPPQGIHGIAVDLLRRGIRPVDGGAHAAHQHQPPVQLLLEGRYIVLRQYTLPHLNADLRHVLHDRDQIGVRVVDGDHAPGPDIAVKPPVRLLEEFPPHFRLHKQRILGAPVVVREDHVRPQIVDEQLHV